METIETALDFVIDVLSTSDLTIQQFDDVDQLVELTRVSRLSEDLYGDDSHAPKKFVLILWNDQKHSFEDVDILVKKHLRKEKNFGKMVGDQVDSYGRGKLTISENPEKLLDLKTEMQATKFVLTVSNMKEYFREEMCDCIIHWLEDLSKARVQGNYFIIQNLISRALCAPWRVGNASMRGEQPTTDEEIIPPICSSLSGAHIPPIDTYSYTLDDHHFEFKKSSNVPSYWLNDGSETQNLLLDGTRIQYLVFFDVRLWKSLRNVLKDIYISVLVSNPQYKPILGHCYAKIYSHIAEHYVLAEREPECSIFNSLSTQLFTTPSIASSICKYNYFSNFLAGLFNFFTKYRVGSVEYISTGATLAGVVSDAQMLKALKNRKYGQLFHDFDFLLNRNNDKAVVTGNADRISQLCDLLMLFQGILPLVRQTGSHVEFESESWISYFNCIPLVLQLANSIALGVSQCNETQTQQCISRIAEFIYKWAIGGFHYQNNENSNGVILTEKVINFGLFSTRLKANGSRIEQKPVSLHHPLHSLLSWFIQFGKHNSSIELKQLLLNAAPKNNYDYSPEEFVAFLFDYPMRTLAFLSQIRTGLWVRNGVSIRSQMYYYRDATLRDQAFDRDVFMTQTALVTLDPQHAFLRFVDIWGIDTFKNNKTFDEVQKIYILEDFLHYLITFITERRQLLGLSDEEAKRKHISREIIQCLAFKPQSYSDICNIIPEFLTSDEQFEVILENLCTFKSPTGIRDSGLYQLKPEYFKYFDTKYLHFSSTKIYDAEKLVRERIVKKEKIPEESVVIEPYLEAIGNPLFVNIAAFTRTQAFAGFVYDLLMFIINTDKEVDSTLSLLLYLCHAAALDDLSIPASGSTSFVHVMSTSFTDNPGNDELYKDVVSLLFHISQSFKFKQFKTTIQRILELLHEKNPYEIETALKNQFGDISFDSFHSSTSSKQDDKESKKKVAKRKKKKILDKFQKQQKKFAAQNNFEVDELSDEDVTVEEKKQHEFLDTPCILCHMPCDEKMAFGVVAHVQISNAYRKIPFNDPDWVLQAYGMHCDLDESLEDFSENYNVSGEWDQYCAEFAKKHVIGPGFPNANKSLCPVLSSCGHVMHYDCYTGYLEASENRSNELARNYPDDPKKGEILCPLCRSLNNIFLPVSWKPDSKTQPQELATKTTFNEFLRAITSPEVTKIEKDDPRIISMAVAHSKNVLPLFAPLLNTKSENSSDTIEDEIYDAAGLAAAVIAGEIITASIGEPQTKTDYPGSLFLCVSGTINDVELSLRGVKSSSLFLSEIPSLTLTFLRSLIEYTSFFTPYYHITDVWRWRKKYFEYKFSPFEADKWTFNEFVKSFFLYSSVYSLEQKHFLKLYVLKEITRVVYRFTSEFNSKEEWTQHSALSFIPTLEAVDNRTVEALSEIISMLYNAIGTPGQQNPMSSISTIGKVIYTMVVKSVTPLLRKAAILTYAQHYNSTAVNNFKKVSDLEADNLCAFLEIPKLSELICEMIDTESGSFFVYKSAIESLMGTVPDLDYPAVQELLHLPERLDQFFTRGESCQEFTELTITYIDPAVCLFCGEVTRTQHASPISPYGECNAHVRSCGISVGMFLLPKRSVILFLTATQGSFFPAPYLDLHGEGEEHYRRRRPQYLNKVRYDHLCRIYWLQHGITDHISRRLSSTIDVGGWDTM